jgi:hypothetical protein
MRIGRVQRWAVITGVAATVLLLLGVLIDLSHFFQAYLVAFLFWLGISLGCLMLLMVHMLAGGPWGFPIQRILTAGARTIPLMAVLFLPLLLGIEYLYVWTEPEVVQADELLRQKAAYLNVPFFTGRSLFYLVVWIVLSLVLTRASYRLDVTGDVRLVRRAQRVSGPGLILLVVTVSFAAIDWSMSLEPYWYSSIYGLLIISGQVLGALSLAVALLALLHDRPPLAGLLRPLLVGDLGKLLLSTLLGWFYFAFIQYLVVWSANLPEEVVWYLNRSSGGWQWVALAVVALHFVLPFILFVLHHDRWRVAPLARIALLLLAMQLLHTYWLVIPAFRPGELVVHWLDLVAPLAMGGIWLALFARHLRRHRLVPFRHPKYVEMVEEEREVIRHAS